jgi:hypothetical protein
METIHKEQVNGKSRRRPIVLISQIFGKKKQLTKTKLPFEKKEHHEAVVRKSKIIRRKKNK